MPSKSTYKADPGWDRHKSIIEKLYLRDNLNLQGSGGLMDTMAKEHGFERSKSQYEWRLKKWGFRKNRTSDDWKSIGWKVAKREHSGISSLVRIDGALVPTAKLQKQVKRNGFATTLGQYTSGSSPRTPDGVEISTPAAEDMTPLLQLQDATLSLPTWTDRSHTFQLDEVTRRCSYRAYDLPFFQLETNYLAQVNQSLIPVNAQRSELETQFGLKSPENDQNLAHSAVAILHEIIPVSENLSAMSKAFLPVVALPSGLGEQQIFSPNEDPLNPAILRLLVFAIANNCVGLDGLPMNKIMDYLKVEKVTRLLNQFLRAQGPESEAFAENLLRIAIKLEDARVVEALLQMELSLNDLVLTVDGQKYSPVEFSAKLHNIEITRLLLDAKARVKNAMKYALSVCVDRRPPLVLLNMLLDASGCEFTLCEIFRVIRIYPDRDLLLRFVNVFTKTQSFDWVESGLLESIADVFENQTATMIITGALQAHSHSLLMMSSQSQEKIVATLNIAASQGNLELVQFLQSYVGLCERTFINAIRSTNVNLVRFLIEIGANVQATFDNTTPLAEAILHKDFEIMKLLERKGAWSSINEGWRWEVTLEAASSTGQVPIVERLLEIRNVHNLDVRMEKALGIAVRKKQKEIACKLLSSGAEVCSRGCSHLTLFIALEQRDAQLVRSILDADADVQSEDFNLVEAARWGNYPIVEELIAMGVDTNAMDDWYTTALVVSIERRDTRLVQILTEAGADVNNPGSMTTGRTALRAAVANGDVEMIDYLLSIGADPDDPPALAQASSWGLPMSEKLLAAFTERYHGGRRGYGCHALQKAIRTGDLPLIDLFLINGIDAGFVPGEHHPDGAVCKPDFTDDFTDDEDDYDGALQSPLGVAIKKEQAADLLILQRLLNANVGPNSTVEHFTYPWHRETALLAAIGTRDIRKMQLVIDAGADVNWPAKRGFKRTPLQKAAQVGSFQAVQTLIDYGATVNAAPSDRGGGTALQLAAIGGYVGIAELLLDNGADVNAPAAKANGRTALQGAAEHGRIDMLRFLLNANAKFDRREYERALHLAKKNGHMATGKYLESLAQDSQLGMDLL